MKRTLLFAIATIAAVIPAQAQQKAITDPVEIIYRVTGLRDDAEVTGTGVATVFSCTNFGTVAERVKFVLRDWDATVLVQRTYDVGAKQTLRVGSHSVNAFGLDDTLTPGTSLNQASALISSSAPEKIVCSAMIMDAAAAYPEGIALPLVRFNRAPGSQEDGRAVSDPLQLLYRISGVVDSGAGPRAGNATAFHCTNFSTVTEKIQINLRNFNGAPVATEDYNIQAGRTFTVTTHLTRLYEEDQTISPDKVINLGSALIFGTAPSKIFCSSAIYDASSFTPKGIDLHAARFNPIPGSME
jgi:hypothetical protein